jgi:hypothetical protein
LAFIMVGDRGAVEGYEGLQKLPPEDAGRGGGRLLGINLAALLFRRNQC